MTLEGIAALVAAAAWPTTVATIAILYRRDLKLIFSAIYERVKAGGELRLGQFELGEVKPQSSTESKAYIDREVKETIGDSDDIHSKGQNFETTDGAIKPPNQSQRLIREKIIRASNLVIDDIQDTYNVVVGKNVKISNTPFDGVFVADNRLKIIEIKYLLGQSSYSAVSDGVSNFILRTTQSTNRLGWKNYDYLLCFVFDDSKDFSADAADFSEKVLGSVLSAFPYLSERVHILTYDYKELEKLASGRM